MTTTVTDSDVYVTYEQFCGLKITATGDEGRAQHAEDCGASEAEYARLDGLLGVARIRAAAASDEDEAAALDEELPADDAPAATFRCSCGSVFGEWPALGEHQTATGHVGMWQETGDALDDDALREREDTVDGARAKIKHNAPQPALLNAPATDDSVLAALAHAMENEARLRTEANKAKNALAHAVKQTKAAAEFAAQHYSASRQLAMNLTVGGTEPDDDDGDDA